MQSETAVLQTLADLVSVNSINPAYNGGVPEAALAACVSNFFSSRGIETWTQLVYPERPNVIARVPGRDSQRRIILEAHMDTVAVDGMAIAPWTPEIRDGRLYGRGACDTKGGMAAMMHAVASIAAGGARPVCDTIFAATIDEEFSYRGVVALCHSLDPGPVNPGVLTENVTHRSALRADAAIVAEPTELRPVIASKGLVRWKIETRGRAAHSSKPALGANAIDAMACLIVEIEKDSQRIAQNHHPLLGAPTCNVGVIRGGVQVNFVPDQCEIEIDRRMLPGETEENVLDSYQQIADRVSSECDGVEILMQPPMLSDCPLETDPQSAAAGTMVEVLQKLGHDPTMIGVPFCSDASKFGALGIPSLILGPGSIDQAHAPVEFVECEQVMQAVEIYRSFIMEFE